MIDTLPEVPEAEARGEIEQLFATIRRETGSPLVNYVWRHLATIEGAAPWCWEFVRCNDVDGFTAVVSDAADAAVRTIRGHCLHVVPLMGSQARSVVDLYNRNNARNLACVSLLLDALRRPERAVVRGASTPTRRPSPSVHAEPVAPLPAWNELSTEDRSTIERLTRAGPAAQSGIAPSLWRHLTVQPGLVTKLAGPLEGMLRSADIRMAFEEFRGEARHRAAELPITRPSVPPFDVARTLDGLERFAARIAELTIAGRALAAPTKT